MTGEAANKPLYPVELRKVLAVVMAIPRRWVAGMVSLAVLSCIDIAHPAQGGWGADFSVTTTTVGIVALIWLPALLRLLALTGGRVKAAGVEASAGGLLGTNEDMIEGLTEIRTATEEVERKTTPDDQTLKSILEQVDQMAAQFVVSAAAIPDEAVTRLAKHYDDLRRTMKAGGDRTVEMTRVVNEARVRANADKEKASRLGLLLIRSKDQGERIVGLAFLQEAPTRSALEDVLALICGSATAFEMFHALLALRAMTPRLPQPERASAIDALQAEMSDPRGVGIRDDANLPGLLADVIAVLSNA